MHINLFNDAFTPHKHNFNFSGKLFATLLPIYMHEVLFNVIIISPPGNNSYNPVHKKEREEWE